MGRGGVSMKPFLSVVIPCRNEARSLGRCLASVMASDYPAERMEVLVVDGASTDGTREVIAAWAASYKQIRMVENPQGTTPAALNRGLDGARGEVIARVDAHAAVTPGYLSRAVEHLESSGADNVGGCMRTCAQQDGLWAGPVIAALTHPFGVGGSQFRIGGRESGEKPRWVDTVFGGCWRRDVFEQVGRFNERLLRGQDMELNQRLRRAGGRILLAPDLVSEYYARTDLRSFWKHNWDNGVWAVLPFAHSQGAPVRARHLAPLGLVLAILAIPWMATIYVTANLAVSAQVAWRERSWRYLAQMPVAFASLHLPYGAGSLWGALRLAAIWIRRKGSMSAGSAALAPDFSSVTEQPHQSATRTQMSMLRTRYGWAAERASGKDVLEVACGAGVGLGLLASAARSVEAGDIAQRNCRIAQETYRGQSNIRVQRMDALDLPFEQNCFDLLLLFEAVYYLPDVPRFLAEARRVLRPGGTLLISTVNCEWNGFHPSPFHTRYWTAEELLEAVKQAGFEARLLTGFPDSARPSDPRNSLRSIAARWGCIPRTMRGRAVLKRIFYGRLDRIPAQLDQAACVREAAEPMIRVDGATDLTHYRNLYLEGRRIAG